MCVCVCVCVTVLLSQTRADFLFFTDEDIAITYSYWDGSGHRRHIKASGTVQSFVQRRGRPRVLPLPPP